MKKSIFNQKPFTSSSAPSSEIFHAHIGPITYIQEKLESETRGL